MKIKIEFTVELDMPSVLDDDYFEITVSKRDFNKEVRRIVHEIVHSSVIDGVVQNDFESKVQQILLDEGLIKK
ncbi:hypothetical protein [Paenibacillus xylaniclasticus]|uniref:hypothetical protein n=1 Tax=Paenibacillus xylaniclasticus TaxID=588083 RepID=UPI000FD8C5B2|nr:hypothetical protein [Paenibacillus xylaniclasticus]GFN32511.1 hypothetical protein PCURB6_27710 [Paenibacillus curdlanolyticus]